METQTQSLAERIDRIIDGILTIRNAKTKNPTLNQMNLNYFIGRVSDGLILEAPPRCSPLPTLELLHKHLPHQEYEILLIIHKLENIGSESELMSYNSLLVPRNDYGIKYCEVVKALEILKTCDLEKIKKRYFYLKLIEEIQNFYDFYRKPATTIINRVTNALDQPEKTIPTRGFFTDVDSFATSIKTLADKTEIEELDELLKRILMEVKKESILLDIKLPRGGCVTSDSFTTITEILNIRGTMCIGILCDGVVERLSFKSCFKAETCRLIVQETIKKITE